MEAMHIILMTGIFYLRDHEKLEKPCYSENSPPYMERESFITPVLT
jgi:hypothetical protein